MKKKSLILATLAGAMLLCACNQKKYKIDYCGEKDFYKGAQDSYAAGTKVKLIYDFIATDTDYNFLVDGEKPTIRKKKDGFEISFTMPEHDVVLECISENTMHKEMTPMEIICLKSDAEEYIVPDDAVSMHVDEYYINKMTLTITNNTKEEISYGEDYRLLIKDGEQYVDLTPKRELYWNDIAYILPAGQQVQVTHDLSMFDLSAGEYKLVKNNELEAEFTLISEWTE